MTKPTDAEIDILQVLWEKQPCTVRTVHETLITKKEVGYTTTLKQMQRMEEKGMLERVDARSKSILYRAVERATTTKKKIVNKLVKNVFGNSISELMMHALGKEKVSAEELEKIKDLIKSLDKKAKK